MSRPDPQTGPSSGPYSGPSSGPSSGAAAAPRVSVVIPHLNHAAALRRCLDALAAQRGAPPFEAIVVDNGSREPPAAVVADFPFARLLAEATPGPGPARSTGARRARGDILAFLDADCLAGPDWLATLAAWLDAHPAVGVIGGDVAIAAADPGRLTPVEAYESVWGYRMQLYVARDGYTATCNMAVRRAVFDAVGDFAGIGVAEDMDWGRRATAAGIGMAYVPAMRIATPARDSFAELARKWDRHIGHDFSAVRGLRGRLRWGARAGALAVSPLAELPRLARTERLSGAAARIRAFGCLARIRLYRARRMLGLLLRGSAGDLAGRWRQT
ncbi:glycosyltransferase [Rhodobacteraceae bacterium 2CG4]|uniref:Glycosyltransferase n=1 Tax=Halovulum marinum TaxID=2662447 RepID=A0A6L5Z576_9RHOB|nr:glycosyltransferase family 2 protein [Halovulum marinum]MSU91716.1 glycosyltransferase [Halovulum marinum]